MRTERALYAAAFLMDLCAGLMAFTVPLLALDLGASVIELGIIGTAGSFAYTIACSFTGKLADRYDRRWLMVIGGLGVIVVTALLGFVSHTWLLILTTALSSSMMALFWPALQAALAEGHSRAQLARVLGNFNMVWTIGFMSGPLLGGALYEIYPRLPFVVSFGAALLIVVGLAFFRLHQVKDQSTVVLEPPDPEQLKTLPRFRAIAWIASFSAFFSLSMVSNQFPKLAQELTISPAALGVMFALPRVIQFLIFMMVRHTHRWQFRLYPLIIPQIAAMIGMVLIATQDSPVVLCLAFSAIGMLIGSSFSASQFYSFFHEAKKGELGAINEMVIGMSNFSAPLIGGILAETMGLRAPYVLCFVVLGVGVLVEYRRAR